MDETYLIFEGGAHPTVYFVQAFSVNDAIWKYIMGLDTGAILQADGSVLEDGEYYPHVLAFIEASEKIHSEWQIRKMPDWVWQTPLVEAFCGESQDGPAYVIAECREHFAKAFPKSRAKAFVWYLKQGTLVTFYRKKGLFNIIVLKRYLWNWDGQLLTVEEWDGDYRQIIDSLDLEPHKVN